MSGFKAAKARFPEAPFSEERRMYQPSAANRPQNSETTLLFLRLHALIQVLEKNRKEDRNSARPPFGPAVPVVT